MILAVHQPQYIPWLGYFHRIAKCDYFVFLDDVQYKKREFQNRNKILTPGGPLWLTLPVITKGHYTQNIKDVLLDSTEDWAKSHFKSIEHNYHKAPHYNEHSGFLTELYSRKWEKLIDVSMEFIKYAMNYLSIKTPWKMSSEYNVTETSTARIIELCKKTGADTYLSGAGGKDYMDEELFKQNGIKLIFQDFKHPEYRQLHGKFEPYMSLVDLFLNCGADSREILFGKS